MNDKESYYRTCESCGRPMAYCKGQCCGKTKGCQCKEYCGKVCGAIRPGEPKCPPQAVIPSLTVESVSNLKDLADCFVHVSDINTTFYIDDKHRIMTTWAGLVSVEDYDFEANPLNLRGQIAYDSKNNVAAIYDKQGANYIFQISDIDNNYMLLENKPQINGVTLEGNKTSADLGILEADEVALVFDTVADMKAATNLVNGSYARTLGFYAINDGGGALYKITDSGTANEMDVIAVGSLFAHLVVNNSVCVQQFGAKGDGITDDQTPIKLALTSGASIINFVKGKTYMIRGYEAGDTQGGGQNSVMGQRGLLPVSNTIIDLNFATIKVIPNDRTNYIAFNLTDVDNIIIQNGSIIGELDNHTGTTGEWGCGISLSSASNITLSNLYIAKFWGDGIGMWKYLTNPDNVDNANIVLRDIVCDGNRRQGMSMGATVGLKAFNCTFKNTGNTLYTSPSSGVDIEPTSNVNDHVDNVLFENCTFASNYGSGLQCLGKTSNVVVRNCLFDKNLEKQGTGCLFFNRSHNPVVDNCKFIANYDANDTYHYGGIYVYCNGTTTFKDSYFKNIRITNKRYSNDYKDDIIVDNCVAEVEYPMQYDEFFNIQNAATGVIKDGSEVHVTNCELKMIAEDKTTPVKSWFGLSLDGNMFSKAFIKDNSFYLGVRGLDIRNIDTEVIGNSFLATTAAPILMNATGHTYVIENNMFAQTAWSTGGAGALQNNAGNNLIMTGNKIYRKMLDVELRPSEVGKTVRFLQGDITTGISEQHENYIIDNSAL